MVKQLVPYDRMAGQYDESVALDIRRVRVAGVGVTYDFRPVIANRLLRRLATDLMLRQQLVDDVGQIPSRPLH